MTYPPQQPGPYGDPYGQRPDSYGQQWGQAGSYGQQPDQTGQQWGQPGPYGQQQWGQQPDPYAQQYGGQQGQFGPPPGGMPPQPPQKKSNTALWVSLGSVGVVAIVALLVTGFAAPGFFLSDDDSGTTADGDDGPSDGAKSTAKNIIAAINDDDQGALKGLICNDASPALEGAIKSIEYVSGAELQSLEQHSDTTAKGKISLNGAGVDTVTGVLEKQDGDWCWKDMQMGGGDVDGSSPGDSDSDYPDMPDSDSDYPDVPGSDSDDSGVPDSGSGDTSNEEFESIAKDFLSALKSGSDVSSLTCRSFEEISGEDYDKVPSDGLDLEVRQRKFDSVGLTVTFEASVGGSSHYGGFTVGDITGEPCVGAFSLG